MLTFWGPRERFCDSLTRRNFLQIGAFGTGLTLADMLRLNAGAKSRTSTKAAIMVFLMGGPSHMDTYDLKPEAPLEYRGEFKPIATNIPGVQISEHFPLQAKMCDKLAILRSVVSSDDHYDSEISTGYSEAVNRTAHHPSFGAVVSKLRGQTDDVPPFVSLRYTPGVDAYNWGVEPGYLGNAHRAFIAARIGEGRPDQLLNNLRLPDNVDAPRMEDRKYLLAAFDKVRRDIDASGTMEGLDGFTARAFDMWLPARSARRWT